MSGIESGWLGTLRVDVGGNLIDTNNTMADPYEVCHGAALAARARAKLGHLSPMGGGRFVRGGVAGLDELSLCQSPLSSPPLPGGYVGAMLSWGVGG